MRCLAVIQDLKGNYWRAPASTLSLYDLMCHCGAGVTTFSVRKGAIIKEISCVFARWWATCTSRLVQTTSGSTDRTFLFNMLCQYFLKFDFAFPAFVGSSISLLSCVCSIKTALFSRQKDLQQFLSRSPWAFRNSKIYAQINWKCSSSLGRSRWFRNLSRGSAVKLFLWQK